MIQIAKENYDKVLEELTNSNTTLVAVSKRQPLEKLQELYDLGQRDFGENRVQEWRDKQPQLPADIKWHLIGQLQRNKVKYIIPHIHLIHSVDRISLLQEINRSSQTHNHVQNILLQVHIAQEETKAGFTINEVSEFIESQKYLDYPHVNICGLMGMATNTTDTSVVEAEFNTLHQLFLKSKDLIKDESFTTLSMGMSGDYQLAISCGSNMVRIGSLIFGARTY